MKTDSTFNAQRTTHNAQRRKGGVVANGEMKEISLPCLLVEFLVSQGLRPASVVVERNGEALAHSDFAKVELADGDRLEIVQVVAGG